MRNISLFPLDVAWALKGRGINVDLLITIDAAHGWENDVRRVVPSNVRAHYNDYQTNPSTWGAGARNSAESASTIMYDQRQFLNGRDKDGQIRQVNHLNIDYITLPDSISRIVGWLRYR